MKNFYSKCSKCLVLLLISSIAILLFLPMQAAANSPPSNTSLFCNSPSLMPPHPNLLEEIRKGHGPLGALLAEEPEPSPIGAMQAVPGPNNVLVLLVNFTDNPAATPPVFFDTLVFSNALGAKSVRNYYREVSYNTIDIVTVNLPGTLGWFLMPSTYAFYVAGNFGFGAYPNNAQRLTEDAVAAADPVVNFANYDNNGDGSVDALCIVHAGPGAEFTGIPNQIWSHKWNTSVPQAVDGVNVFDYAMMPEYWLVPGDMTSGVFDHELGHVFGAPDLYDTDFSSNGVGSWCLMSYGAWNGPGNLGSDPAHPCAWIRQLFGFVTPTNVTVDLPGQSIPSVESTAVSSVYRLWQGGAVGPEYFLVENRQQTGFDTWLPGNGILIWHIDETQPNNDNEFNYLVDLEEAHGGVQHLQAAVNPGDPNDPFPGGTGNTLFDDSTDPNANAYSGSPTNIAVDNISNSGDPMTGDLLVGITQALVTGYNTYWLLFTAISVTLAGGYLILMRKRRFCLNQKQ